METQIYRFNRPIKAAVLLGDLILCNILLYVFNLFDLFPGNDVLLHDRLLHTELLISLVYIICTIHNGVILHMRKVHNYQIVLRVLRNTVYTGILGTVVLYIDFRSLSFLSNFSLFLLAFFILCSIYRLIFRMFIYWYRMEEKHQHHVVLVGSTSNNEELYHELTDDRPTAYKVYGYFDDEPNPKFPKECPYLGKPEDAIEYLKNNPQIHQLFCCLPSRQRDVIIPIIDYCTNHLVRFYSVPNVRNYLHNNVYLQMYGNVPVLSLLRNPLDLYENRILKRAFDIVFSLLFLCTLFPIIFVIVAIITKTTMPGPIFFRQKRNGLNDKEFYCYKFRSMKVNKDADVLQATKNDPRKTKWGNIMRKTNIDELPQFINVLLGDMSIVGPRPHMLKHTEEYSQLINKYMVRHFVKPGITGWSQVTGFRGETKELYEMEGRIKGDIYYIEHWTFGLDLYIIYKTVANVFKGEKKAY